MARQKVFPTLYDECKTITISFLKNMGYLEEGTCKQGNIKWSRNGHQTGSISIVVDMLELTPYLELQYTYQSKVEVNYKVFLHPTTSNLGKGKVWYFVCPRTNKRCRKLYLVNGCFLHRTAFKGGMYDIQTQSAKGRHVTKLFIQLQKSEKAHDLLYSKHFKRTYKGKPTKRYLQVIQEIEDGKGVKIEDLLPF